jgi:L-cysteine S-thiosulfotransferase
MKKLIATVAVSLMGASVTFAAGVVAPSEVKFDNGEVAGSLTDVPGDAVAGRETFAGRKLGNCLACHLNADLSDLGFPGEVGPPLDGVGDRYTQAQLRGIVTNSKNTFEDTIMPAFYRDPAEINRPLEGFEGTTILTAQQVEDVVAYLLTLKEE